MIGIDIVKIERISQIESKFGQRFLSKFMLKNEIKLAKNKSTIAGIWAAKEATSKALGCGIGSEFGFLDVEIYKDFRGSPKLQFTQKIINKFSILSSSLSISHDGGFAIAVVVIKFNHKEQ